MAKNGQAGYGDMTMRLTPPNRYFDGIVFPATSLVALAGQEALHVDQKMTLSTFNITFRLFEGIRGQ